MNYSPAISAPPVGVAGLGLGSCFSGGFRMSALSSPPASTRFSAQTSYLFFLAGKFIAPSIMDNLLV